MLILVTGATGAIGPRVVHTLVQAGFRIRAFSVDTPTAGMFSQSVEVLIGDVTDQVAVQSANARRRCSRSYGGPPAHCQSAA